MVYTKNVVAENRDEIAENNNKDTAKILGGFAGIAGLGAVLASSCCLMPLLLAAVGASAGVFTAFQYLAEWKIVLLGIASVSLGGSWYVWWKKRSIECCSTTECVTNNSNIKTLSVLCLSTALIMLAFSWEYIEPIVLKVVKGHI